MILRNLPKFLKAQKISQASYKEEILYYSENKEVKKFFVQKMRKERQAFSLSEIVNSLLKKDIEISEKLAR